MFGENGLASLFFCKTPEGLVEVTVLFEDEDRPEKWADPIYDTIREHIFHRKEDIETFWIQLSSEGIPEKLIFKGSWAGPEQSWLQKTPKHLEGEFPITDFEIQDNRPVIWIVTWNHLFGAKNTNTNLKHITYSKYPAYLGSRAEIDQWFKKHKSS
jgi:hypothetical protein